MLFISSSIWNHLIRRFPIPKIIGPRRVRALNHGRKLRMLYREVSVYSQFYSGFVLTP
ncbi:hypothetical protein V22_09610 [Calycomorphotria hydatis]|uniref:Uncharacterized protein n=1 Tax=Calycomorphotria hydatis TaxID=2528027 RepID=A0A517T5S2_9PLAN|nr:hypothetical protein V22_09610 [Calycomorphotria hydatis]